MPYVNIPNSDLSILVGKLLGKVEGEVRSRAQDQIQELINEFKSEAICSNIQRLENIKKKKDNINSVLLKFKKRVEKIRKITDPLLTAVSTFKLIVTILKSLPVPTTPAVTVGTIVTFSDRLEQAKEFIIQVEEDVRTINNLILGAAGTLVILDSILSRLNIIDSEIEKCRNLNENNQTSNNIDNIIEREEIDNPTPPDTFQYISSTGREYIIEIVNDTVESLAPLRYAIAKEVPSYNIAYIGEKSYSSSTEILVQELKFKIDTELT